MSDSWRVCLYICSYIDEFHCPCKLKACSSSGLRAQVCRAVCTPDTEIEYGGASDSKWKKNFSSSEAEVTLQETSFIFSSIASGYKLTLWSLGLFWKLTALIYVTCVSMLRHLTQFMWFDHTGVSVDSYGLTHTVWDAVIHSVNGAQLMSADIKSDRKEELSWKT